MKIALLVSSFPRLSETFIVNKFLGLLSRGHDVHVLCSSVRLHDRDHFPLLKDPKVWSRVHERWPIDPRWIPVVLAPMAVAFSAVRRPTLTFRYLRQGLVERKFRVFRRLYLDQHLLRLKPDLIHFEFGTQALEHLDAARWLHALSVVSFRGYDINLQGQGDLRGHYASVWAFADGIHCLGQHIWEAVQARGCPASKPRALIPPAIDVRKYDQGGRHHEPRIGTEQRPCRLLSVARFVWKKGHEYLLQAIRLLLDRGLSVELRLIGSGQYFEPIGYLTRVLDLARHVTIVGDCTPSDLPKHLSWADIFVHAAVEEGFGNAVIEAQASRLPIVCSDAGGLPENVEDGVSGFVVPRRSPSAMAEKIELLARDVGLRRRMGDAGWKRAQERFDIKDQIAAFERFYLELSSLASARRAPAHVSKP